MRRLLLALVATLLPCVAQAQDSAPRAGTPLDAAGNIVNVPAPRSPATPGDGGVVEADDSNVAAALARVVAAGGGTLRFAAGVYHFQGTPIADPAGAGGTVKVGINIPAVGPGFSRITLEGQGDNATVFAPLPPKGQDGPMAALVESDNGYADIRHIRLTNAFAPDPATGITDMQPSTTRIGYALSGLQIADNNNYPKRIQENTFIGFVKAIRVLRGNAVQVERSVFLTNLLAISYECIGGYVLDPTFADNYVLGGSGVDFPVAPADPAAPRDASAPNTPASWHTEGAQIYHNKIYPARSQAYPAGQKAPVFQQVFPAGSIETFGVRIMTGLGIWLHDNTLGQNYYGPAVRLDAVSGAGIMSNAISEVRLTDNWMDGGDITQGAPNRSGFASVGPISRLMISGLTTSAFTGWGIIVDGVNAKQQPAPVGSPIVIDRVMTFTGAGGNGFGDISLTNVPQVLMTGVVSQNAKASVAESGSTVVHATTSSFAVPPRKAGAGSSYVNCFGAGP